MTTAAIAFSLSLACSTLLTPLARRMALRLGAVDHALSSRKVHKTAIPRLGGIAIVCAFFVPLIALAFTRSGVGDLFYAHREPVLGLFLGGAVIAALGIYDDIRGAGAPLKFAVQFGVGGLVYALGYRIDVITNPFGGVIELGWLGLPFTLLWVAGVINAINLIDGLDGLAGGVAFISLVTVFVAAAANGYPLMMLASAALAGAVLGFLRYNFNPATIFMGDTGSMFLGFVLATTAIRTSLGPTAAVSLIAPIVALGLPITDTLLAMVRRAMRGAPLFQADRDHIHHRLLARGLSQRQTVLVLYVTSTALGLIALGLASASGSRAAVTLLGLALVGGLALRRLGYMQFQHAGEVLALRRRNLELRDSVRQIAEQLRHATRIDHVWDAVRRARPALGADHVSLRLVEGRAQGPRDLLLQDGFAQPGSRLFRSRHSLGGERPDSGVLEFGWANDRKSITRDTELAIEQLAAHVRRAVNRMAKDDLSRRVAPIETVVSDALAVGDRPLARASNGRR